jgi:hypothetical protein
VKIYRSSKRCISTKALFVLADKISCFVIFFKKYFYLKFKKINIFKLFLYTDIKNNFLKINK